MKSLLIPPKNKEEMEKILNIVVAWYEKYYKNKEIERFSFDLAKTEDRLKVFIERA